MNKYRSHLCNQLNEDDSGSSVLISGWVHRKRDHGNLLFIDLRDNYGLTQCVIDNKSPIFKDIESLALETVIRIEGKVIERSKETINKSIETG